MFVKKNIVKCKKSDHLSHLLHNKILLVWLATACFLVPNLIKCSTVDFSPISINVIKVNASCFLDKRKYV